VSYFLGIVVNLQLVVVASQKIDVINDSQKFQDNLN